MVTLQPVVLPKWWHPISNSLGDYLSDVNNGPTRVTKLFRNTLKWIKYCNFHQNLKKDFVISHSIQCFAVMADLMFLEKLFGPRLYKILSKDSIKSVEKSLQAIPTKKSSLDQIIMKVTSKTLNFTKILRMVLLKDRFSGLVFEGCLILIHTIKFYQAGRKLISDKKNLNGENSTYLKMQMVLRIGGIAYSAIIATALIFSLPGASYYTLAALACITFKQVLQFYSHHYKMHYNLQIASASQIK